MIFSMFKDDQVVTGNKFNIGRRIETFIRLINHVKLKYSVFSFSEQIFHNISTRPNYKLQMH